MLSDADHNLGGVLELGLAWGAGLVNQAVVASFPAAPPDVNLVVGVVGINFYQQVNGKFYPQNNNSTNPLLTQALHANSGQEVLMNHLAQSAPGEEVVLFNQVPDGNGEQERPLNPLFGELVPGTPIIPPAPTAEAPAREAASAPVMLAAKTASQAGEAFA